MIHWSLQQLITWLMNAGMFNFHYGGKKLMDPYSSTQ